MLFNSYSFVFFLPLMLLLFYSITHKRLRILILLTGSYYFYCFTYPMYGLLLLFSTCLDYLVGLGMGRSRKKGLRSLLLLVSIVGNLGVLMFFKYADFLGQSGSMLLNAFGGHTEWERLGFLLPIGISFYTFQTMSYTIELYRGTMEPCRNFFLFALYVSFFPQLVAGPIERAPDLLPQLKEFRSPTYDDIIHGLHRLGWGMVKKVVIADRLAFFVDKVYTLREVPHGAPTLWIATYAFAFQIYFDFSGYSDIAIGTARLFGVTLRENFNLPYMASNISEFWRRWHISFSTWLRDYLYIPLGGSRNGISRTLLNVCVVMFLGGLWHGAAWTFVVWGLYQGLLLVLYHGSKMLIPGIWGLTRGKPTISRMVKWMAVLLNFHLACIGWVFFRAHTLGQAWHMIRTMTNPFIQLKFLPPPSGMFIFLLFCIVLYAGHAFAETGIPQRWIANIKSPTTVAAIYMGYLVLLLLFGAQSGAKFIYFQF